MKKEVFTRNYDALAQVACALDYLDYAQAKISVNFDYVIAKFKSKNVDFKGKCFIRIKFSGKQDKVIIQVFYDNIMLYSKEFKLIFWRDDEEYNSTVLKSAVKEAERCAIKNFIDSVSANPYKFNDDAKDTVFDLLSNKIDILKEVIEYDNIEELFYTINRYVKFIEAYKKQKGESHRSEN
jgi:hypothetical protein